MPHNKIELKIIDFDLSSTLDDREPDYDLVFLDDNDYAIEIIDVQD